MTARAAWRELTEWPGRLRPELAERVGGGRSLVAEANAMFRASEQARPAAARIVDDALAARFVGPHPLLAAVAAARHLAPPLRHELELLRVAHCTRHRSIDELLIQALADGYRQVVLLGAGLDTRPLRLAAAAGEGCRWVEVDGPAVLAYKRRRLPAAWPAAPLAADLRRDDLTAGLVALGVDLAAPICFVAEGLLHYLPAAPAQRLADAIGAGAAPRRLLLSCITPAMAAQATSTFAQLVKLVREVPRRFDDAESLRQRHGATGLGLEGYWDFAAQVANFAPQAAGAGVRLSQDVARLDRGAP